MGGFLARLAAAIALLFAHPALAQENSDITAAARSVVRIALVETHDGEQYLLGHASGVAVAPNLIVTNAHVVAPLEMADDIGMMIVPAEGSRRYVGRLVAVDPRADLALIRLESGAIPPATIYTGPLDENARVAAIGYPGSVDLAENLSARDRVTPMDAVRTFGQISGGRSRRDVQTLLHTAAMAQGNSGGPLVDACGRIVGVNSFGSISSGSDAEFAFAIAARELVPFLRANGVRPRTIGLACESMAERDRREALRR
ncbi:MAG: trypsin-like peptidase domain-containing protein, partial [Sphingomonadaceae bacterium]|nr:trypsin-like peptidase domain-containing protein [Sphingomonadaceae bacterium]